MLYFMGIINFQLMALYIALFIIALVYGYVWQQVYEHSLKSDRVIDTAFLKALHIPFYLLLILYAATTSIPYLPSWFFKDYAFSPESFDMVFPIGFTVLVLWVFNHTLTNVQQHIMMVQKNDEVPNSMAWISACKFGRIISILIFLLAAMYQLEVPMTQFLAPTVFGGLAFTIAAKDILSNMFGGLMVMVDRPFSVGDFVAIGNNDVGTVRYIGWRMTEVQLRNGRILHVPNGLITNSVVTNYSEKTHWYVEHKIGVRYEDFEKAPKIAADIAAWINEHPQVNKRRGNLSHVVDIGDSSVNIRVRACLRSSLNNKQYHEFVEEMLVQINKIVKKHKSDFAFPTRTMLMEKK